ncbi:MAG: class I SAM-dependent rRNA methyltransferase [Planctomycetota bacterium]|nr:class I SAM-dependent rRNA methyltransferase [Planctomycetota bacterium]
MSIPTLRVKARHLKPLRAGHPWVFAEAVEALDGEAAPGDELRVVEPNGRLLGRGYYSPKSAMAVRLLTRADEPLDAAFLRRRLEEAQAWRRELYGLGGPDAPRGAYRLVNAEGDGLGGLVVDVYGPYLCVQLHTAGMERRREELFDALEGLRAPEGILDRSDARIRSIEGLPPAGSAPAHGAAPDAPVELACHGARFEVDLRGGQKTGLYLDQLENQAWLGAHAKGREVLDAFSYTGGFALHAARGGAKSLTLIERSAPALAAARANLERNGVADADLIEGDWKECFRHLREAGRGFELAVLDPPKFAKGKADVPSALDGYRALNAEAARLLRPGGLLFTCSCSGNVSELEFERAVAAGVAQAGRRAALLARRGHPPDHPVPPGFDQGRYLKALLLRLS